MSHAETIRSAFLFREPTNALAALHRIWAVDKKARFLKNPAHIPGYFSILFSDGSTLTLDPLADEPYIVDKLPTDNDTKQ